ncbi:MAG TPA: ATP-binding protein [Chthoniobacterales bacterium]|nr:ATP-binding protein [Chthoniobacterales bacterium]
MKVQTKITLLLALVVTAFVTGALAFRTFDRFKFRRIAQERITERNHSFDTFLQRNGEPLETLVEDSTCLDRMVQAVADNDEKWLSENFNDATLGAFHANAVWIYRADGTLLYQRNNLNTSDFGELPVSKNDFFQMFAKEPLRQFFAQLPHGLMELRAGTIHPSKDFQRKTRPRGYLLAGRLWNQPTLNEMSLFTGNEISLAPDGEKAAVSTIDHPDSVSFERVLEGWDGKPVARLIIRNSSQVVKELERESQALMLWIVIFALFLLLLISSSLVRWVRRPLRTIMRSLAQNDPRPIEALCADHTEFGQLARTLRTFFAQRDKLIQEIEERRATEAALREKEHELRHAQKLEAVGRLAGGVAHDFNNLLTAIIGYAELIIKRAQQDPIIRQNSALIRKAGEQAASLTRQLLAFSRKQLLQPKVLDLNDLVRDVQALLHRVIGEHFELRTEPCARDGRVRADPTQLEQIILNLGVNARDAMPNGGVLKIRTDRIRLDYKSARRISSSLKAGDYVVLSVEDTGTGMDAETKARIFEPFFTTKGPGKGTGLGLATVYGIVKQSGGGILVDTEPGRGTCFHIYFPHERRPVDQVKTITVEPPVGSNFETVLVVEDDEIVRELVCDVLEGNGYTVLCAMDGPAALKMAEEYDKLIDLLVTDVVMPQMNGPELASRLSLLRPELKVLYVSGYSADDIGDHGVLKEDLQLLQKPFSPQSLLQRVREVLSHREEYPANLSEGLGQLQFSM